MDKNLPNLTSILPVGIWAGRRARGIFLKRHDLDVNVKIIQEEVEKFARIAPLNEQLFLIEGYSNYFSRENDYVKQYVQGNGIAVIDPIVDPFTFNNSDAAQVDRIQAAVSVLMFDCLYSVFQDNGKLPEESELKELVRRSIEVIAKKFCVSQIAVEKEFCSLSVHDKSALQLITKVFFETRKKLIDFSNKRSRDRLIKILSTCSEQNVLIVAGAEHEIAFCNSFVCSSLIKLTRSLFKHQSAIRPCNIVMIREELNSLDMNLILNNLCGSIQDSGLKVLAAGGLGVPSMPGPTDFYPDIYKVNPTIVENDLNRRGYTPWQKFILFEQRLATDDPFERTFRPWPMFCFVEQSQPKPLGSKLYSESNLMKFAVDPSFSYIPWYSKLAHAPNNPELLGRSHAAMALASIVEKIGDQLPDQAEIIRKLLFADDADVRFQGSLAACDTTGHKWRHHLLKTGLITALPRETDHSVRCSIVTAIAGVTAELLKEGSSVHYLEDPAIAKTLISMFQRNFEVDDDTRVNVSYLLAGLCRLTSKYDSEINELFDHYASHGGHEYLRENSLEGLAVMLERGATVYISINGLRASAARKNPHEGRPTYYEPQGYIIGDNTVSVRCWALFGLGHYLARSQINDSQLLDSVLIEGLEDKETRTDALFAVANRIERGTPRMQEFLQYIEDGLNSEDDPLRVRAFYALGKYLRKVPSAAAKYKNIARSHFTDRDGLVRIGATNVFGIALENETEVVVEDGDVGALFNIGRGDSEESARVNAIFILSIIILRDPNRLTRKERFELMALCNEYKDYKLASEQERKTMANAATTIQKEYSGLRDSTAKDLPSQAASNIGDLLAGQDAVVSLQAEKIAQQAKLIQQLKDALSDAITQLKALKLSQIEDHHKREDLRIKLEAANRKILELERAKLNKMMMKGTLDTVGLCVPGLNHFKIGLIAVDAYQTLNEVCNN